MPLPCAFPQGYPKRDRVSTGRFCLDKKCTLVSKNYADSRQAGPAPRWLSRRKPAPLLMFDLTEAPSVFGPERADTPMPSPASKGIDHVETSESADTRRANQ